MDALIRSIGWGLYAFILSTGMATCFFWLVGSLGFGNFVWSFTP